MFRDPQMAAALQADRGRGRGGLLSGRHRQGHSEDQRPPGRQDELRRPERIPVRMGGAASPPITTAGRSTSCRPTGRASPRSQMLNMLSLFPLVQLPVARRRGTAHADRGAETGLRRPAPLRGRPALQQGAGGGHALHGLRPRARQADRSRQGALRRGTRESPTSIRGRHHLSLGGGPRRQYRLADPEPVPAFRIGRGGGRLSASRCRIAAACSS